MSFEYSKEKAEKLKQTYKNIKHTKKIFRTQNSAQYNDIIGQLNNLKKKNYNLGASNEQSTQERKELINSCRAYVQSHSTRPRFTITGRKRLKGIKDILEILSSQEKITLGPQGTIKQKRNGSIDDKLPSTQRQNALIKDSIKLLKMANDLEDEKLKSMANELIEIFRENKNLQNMSELYSRMSFYKYSIPNEQDTYSDIDSLIDDLRFKLSDLSYGSLMPHLDYDDEYIKNNTINATNDNNFKLGFRHTKFEQYSQDYPIFSYEPKATDIIQTDIGNCWLLAGLAQLAESNPDIIKKSIIDNGDGTVTIRLYKNGTAKFYTISKSVPKNHYSALWVKLFEKAIAVYLSEDNEKLKNKFSYKALDGNTIDFLYNMLTGETEINVMFNKEKFLNGKAKNHIEETSNDKIKNHVKKTQNGKIKNHIEKTSNLTNYFYNVILSYIKNNKYICCNFKKSVHKQNINGLVSKHSYSILGVRESRDPITGEKLKYILIRNPWGNFGDTSLKQNSKFFQMNNGIMWIELNVFVNNFAELLAKRLGTKGNPFKAEQDNILPDGAILRFKILSQKDSIKKLYELTKQTIQSDAIALIELTLQKEKGEGITNNTNDSSYTTCYIPINLLAKKPYEIKLGNTNYYLTD